MQSVLSLHKESIFLWSFYRKRRKTSSGNKNLLHVLLYITSKFLHRLVLSVRDQRKWSRSASFWEAGSGSGSKRKAGSASKRQDSGALKSQMEPWVLTMEVWGGRRFPSLWWGVGSDQVQIRDKSDSNPHKSAVLRLRIRDPGWTSWIIFVTA